MVYNPDAMKLAILGTRGIPANYGGFETFAEELSTRLVVRGHDVTVYGRSNNIRYRDRTYKGVKLAILPTIGTKQDRKSTRLNSSHIQKSRMPSSA